MTLELKTCDRRCGDVDKCLKHWPLCECTKAKGEVKTGDENKSGDEIITEEMGYPEERV